MGKEAVEEAVPSSNSNGAEVVKFLNRDDILNALDEQYEIIDVPEWGGKVRIKGLNGIERDAFEQSMIDQRTPGQAKANLYNIRAKLVCLAVVDGDNKPLFTKTDVERLGMKSAKALDRVYDVAQRMSGLSRKDIETLAGNSDETREDGSTLL